MLFKYTFQEIADGPQVTFYARGHADIESVLGKDHYTKNVLWEPGNPLCVNRAEVRYDGWKDMLNTGKDGVLTYKLSPELLVYLNTQKLDELARDVSEMQVAKKLCRLNSSLYLPDDLAGLMKGHDWMGHAQDLMSAYESAINKRSKPTEIPERRDNNLSDNSGNLPGKGNSKYWPGTSYIDKGTFGKSND